MPDAADLLARLEALEAELQGERTRRHLAEELARCYSEAAFEAIILHEQGVVIEVNQAAVEIRGGTREEYLGLPISALVAPESWADVAARQAEGSSGPYEITAVRHDGSTVPMEARARNIEFMGRLVRVVAGHDLTARKSAEARLAESEQRYRAIAENSSDIIVVSDLTGMPSFVSSACRRILGYEPDELLAMNWMDNIHPEDLVSLTAPSPPRQPGDAPSESEFRAKTKDGHYVWLASTTTRLSDPQTGAVVALQSSIRDITERKRLADQQLEL